MRIAEYKKSMPRCEFSTIKSKERFAFLPLMKRICSSFAALSGDLSISAQIFETPSGESADFRTAEKPVHVFVFSESAAIGPRFFFSSSAAFAGGDFNADLSARRIDFSSGAARDPARLAIFASDSAPSAGGKSVVAAPAEASASTNGSAFSFMAVSFTMSRKSPYSSRSERAAPARASAPSTSPVANPRPTAQSLPHAEFLSSTDFKYFSSKNAHSSASPVLLETAYSRHAKASALLPSAQQFSASPAKSQSGRRASSSRPSRGFSARDAQNAAAQNSEKNRVLKKILKTRNIPLSGGYLNAGRRTVKQNGFGARKTS